LELLRLGFLDLSLKDNVNFRMVLMWDVCSAKWTSSFLLQKLAAALNAVLVIAIWLELTWFNHEVVAYVAVELSE